MINFTTISRCSLFAVYSDKLSHPTDASFVFLSSSLYVSHSSNISFAVLDYSFSSLGFAKSANTSAKVKLQAAKAFCETYSL